MPWNASETSAPREGSCTPALILFLSHVLPSGKTCLFLVLPLGQTKSVRRQPEALARQPYSELWPCLVTCQVRLFSSEEAPIMAGSTHHHQAQSQAQAWRPHSRPTSDLPPGFSRQQGRHRNKRVRYDSKAVEAMAVQFSWASPRNVSARPCKEGSSQCANGRARPPGRCVEWCVEACPCRCSMVVRPHFGEEALKFFCRALCRSHLTPSGLFRLVRKACNWRSSSSGRS